MGTMDRCHGWTPWDRCHGWLTTCKASKEASVDILIFFGVRAMRAKFGELGRGSAFKVGLRPDRWKDFKVGLRAPTRSMCTGAVPVGQRIG